MNRSLCKFCCCLFFLFAFLCLACFCARNIMGTDGVVDSFLICTYIHNWLLQPFCQDCDLHYHTIHAVCVNFIYKWQNLQFKVDSERQIFEKLLMATLSTHKVFAERKPSKKYNFIFPIYVLEYGNFPLCRLPYLLYLPISRSFYKLI